MFYARCKPQGVVKHQKDIFWRLTSKGVSPLTLCIGLFVSFWSETLWSGNGSVVSENGRGIFKKKENRFMELEKKETNKKKMTYKNVIPNK